MSPARVHREKVELIYAATGRLVALVADAWLREIGAANKSGRSHNVALSGGRIVQKLFASVVEEKSRRNVSFENVHFFWADERCVPPADAESNYRLAQELLFVPLGISERQIHRVRGEGSPQSAAVSAESEICGVVSGNDSGVPVLDLIFLGMGEDGHVASLFPGEPAGDKESRIYRAVLNSPKPPPNRVTLTYPVLAAAKNVWVVASGAGKEQALQRSLTSETLPLGRLIGSRNHTKVFTDIAL